MALAYRAHVQRLALLQVAVLADREVDEPRIHRAIDVRSARPVARIGRRSEDWIDARPRGAGFLDDRLQLPRAGGIEGRFRGYAPVVVPGEVLGIQPVDPVEDG